MKLILSLCSGTGAWEQPYKQAGYEVVSVTLPDDVRLFVPPSNIHGILAAPPCTEFAASGARWWEGKGEKKLLEGLEVVAACCRIILISNPVFWCMENPVGRLKNYIGNPVMYFNPCDYGDPWTKKTCLWGKFNMPTKKPVEPTEGSKMLKFGPSSGRQALRSETPGGFAKAFFEANP